MLNLLHRTLKTAKPVPEADALRPAFWQAFSFA